MARRFQRLTASAALCLAFLGAQAAAQQTTNIVSGCAQTYDANTDYFPEKLATNEDDASFFNIEYHNNYKLVSDHRNNKTYCLVQCGTTTPAGLAADVEVYQVPVTNAAALETTVVPYLEMLGVAETISLVADASSVSSSCFQKYLQDNSSVVQMSSSNQTLATQQMAQVQVLFGADPYDYTGATDNTTVSTAEVYETDVLGRSAWIWYYAAFYNLEGLANQVVQNMTNNYNNLKEAASGYSDDQKPLVAWTTYNAPDQYNNNTASWTVSTAAYKAQLTQDAGGRLYNGSTLSYTSASDFLQAMTDVDIMIDETYVATTLSDVLGNYQISDDKKDSYKFVKNEAIYREDGILTPSGGYDWFAAAVVMGDALLEDVVNAVNPSAPSSDFKRKWLRNVAKDESIYYTSAKNCSWDETKPRPNAAVSYSGDKFAMSDASTQMMSGAAVAVSALLASVFLLA